MRKAHYLVGLDPVGNNDRSGAIRRQIFHLPETPTVPSRPRPRTIPWHGPGREAHRCVAKGTRSVCSFPFSSERIPARRTWIVLVGVCRGDGDVSDPAARRSYRRR
jgi:hypothetical protein